MSNISESYDTTFHESIPIGKSLTPSAFENILKKYYLKSLDCHSIDFDLSLVEWISLLELLLLIQWINKLVYNKDKKDVKVLFPKTSFINGIDDTEFDSLTEKPILHSMYRRQRVSSFLERLQFPKEIRRLTGKIPHNNESNKHSSAQEGIDGFDDCTDPHDVRILPVKSFWRSEDLAIQKELSSDNLRLILKEHSCLDAIDSGMLADIVIEELVTNALMHGINRTSKEHNESFQCAWISARLVKSSRSTIEEAFKWCASYYKSLLGKHYLELSLCDNGLGIFEHLKDYVPSWLLAGTVSIKAVLDYAFDKFSSSSTGLRTDHDKLPRGLFWVHDLVRQYGGILSVRSGGFFMVYDFLTKSEQPRILDLWDSGGACTDLGGTAIQIILPESKGFFLPSISSQIRDHLRDPVIFQINPTEDDESNFEASAKKYANELELLCQGNTETPIIVDITALDDTKNQDVYLLFCLLRYIIYLENPNLLILLGSIRTDLLEMMNELLVDGFSAKIRKSNLNSDAIHKIFDNFTLHDRRICPLVMPNGEFYWVGANDFEIKVFKNLWGAIKIELSDFGEFTSRVLEIARSNPHLIHLSKDHQINDSVMEFRFDIYDLNQNLIRLLREATENIIRLTPQTIHKEGCYHLPHGTYSHFYVYSKPIFSKPHLIKRLSRYLLTLFYLSSPKRSSNIELVVGGTHSTKKLIQEIGNELSVDILTIDRYTDQLNEPSISEIVANKHVLIISDVMSSGNFVDRVVNRLSQEGCDIISICTICDLRKNAIENSNIGGVPVTSLVKLPIDRYEEPDKEPVFEVNPISLKPTNVSEEKLRSDIPSLISEETFFDWIGKSTALVPAHVLLGPTHYTYFVDTWKIMDQFSEEIFSVVKKDLESCLESEGMSAHNDLSTLITAEGSNAEAFFPQLLKKVYPKIKWIQIDRIRLSMEGMWLLDRLDSKFDPLDVFQNSAVIVWDDGSNTGGTLTQLLEIISEFNPKIILAYCLVNRLSKEKSRFFSRLTRIGNNQRLFIKFVATLPVATYIGSNCPICNRYIPDIPPIMDIQKYWEEVSDICIERRWNHISSNSIQEKALNLIQKRDLCDLDDSLSEIFRVRCILGNFENSAGTTKEERANLAKCLEDERSLAALCFIINREPDLLDSVVNFQIPSFQNDLLESIMKKVRTTKATGLVGKQDILEIVASRKPELIVENLFNFITNVIKTKDLFIATISRLIASNEIHVVQDLLNKMLSNLDLFEDNIDLRAYMRGLCNACISWLNLEKASESEEIPRAIRDLQSFYRQAGKPHGEVRDIAAPLNRIINYLQLSSKSGSAPEKKHFDSVYRDWRDYTVPAIETRLQRIVISLKDILKLELPPFIYSYYLSKGGEGLRSDYLELQKLVSELRGMKDQDVFLKEHSGEVMRITKRLYEYNFDADKSPLSRIMDKIPVFIVKQLDERLAAHRWIEVAKIEVLRDIPHKEIYAFMTSRSFKKILDSILLNIKVHNFKINEANLMNGNYDGHNIAIKVDLNASEVVITIRSNGLFPYEDKPSHGIMTIKDICRVYGAKFDIINEDNWVKNEIILKRW